MSDSDVGGVYTAITFYVSSEACNDLFEFSSSGETKPTRPFSAVHSQQLLWLP